MKHAVEMPQLGESMASGVISEWLKNPGDPVRMGEGLVVVETEKVESEIPASVAGFLLEQLAQRGDDVPVGEALATIVDTEAELTGTPATPRSPSAPGPAVEPAPEPESGPMSAPVSGPVSAPGSAPISACAPSYTAPRAREAGGDRRRLFTPVVRKLAEQHDVDLDASPIRGTGRGGRVTKKDLLGWLEAGGSSPVERRPVDGPPTGGADASRVPLSQVRKRIAKHMRHSVDTAAHVTTVYEMDLTALDAARSAAKDAFLVENGAPLTITVLLVQALARALKRHPEFNASVDDEVATFHQRVGIAIATALDRSLVTPVIHDADRLSVPGIAARLSDVVGRARAGALGLEDLEGGTFTLTNTGRTGAIMGTPIINQPQVAILHSGALRDVVTVTGPASFAVRKKAFLSLTFDHRWVDGADADAFMGTLREVLEETPWTEVIR